MAQGPPERFSRVAPIALGQPQVSPKAPYGPVAGAGAGGIRPKAICRCLRKNKCLAQPKPARPSRDPKESGQMHSCAPHLLKAGHSLTRRAGHPSVWPFHEITLGVRPTSPLGANHFVACKHRDYRQNAGISGPASLSCERWLAQRCSARSSARPLYGGSYMFCQVARFYS